MSPFSRFSIPKAAFFTWGMVVSYTFIENSVSSQLMDYLTSSLKNQRIAAMITNLQDGLSNISVVIVYLISEAYTGRFTMVAFCSSASIMGLMLFWISFIWTRRLEYDMIYVAIFLITLGSPGGSMSEEFLDYQLDEGKQDLKRNNERRRQVISFCGRLTGYTIAIIFAIFGVDQQSLIAIGSLLMVGTYLFFYTGYPWYIFECPPGESNIGKICRIFKTAYRNKKIEYPTAEERYHRKNDKKSHRVVAIKEQSADDSHGLEQQPRRGELFTVKEASEIKNVALLICWGYTFFAYDSVLASGNTFFVAQARILTTFTGNDLSLLFILKSSVSDILPMFCWCFGIVFKRMGIVAVTERWVKNFGFKRTDATVLKVSFGMACALICCLLARHVEVQRLRLIEEEGILQNPDLNIISMSTKALIPQFLVLGVAEWLAEEGLEELFQGYASKTMRSFDESFCQLVIGTGKLLAIPSVLIFKSWIQESSNTSRLDKYYRMLAALNIVFFLLFIVYYYMYAYENEYPEDEEIGSEQTSENAQQADSGEAKGREEISTIREGAMASKEGEETVIKPVIKTGSASGLRKTLSKRVKSMAVREGPMVAAGASCQENNDEVVDVVVDKRNKA